MDSNAGKEQRYLISVNKRQLKLIADCIEDVSRYAAGDCEMQNTNSDLISANANSIDEILKTRRIVGDLSKALGKLLNGGSGSGDHYDYNGNGAPKRQKELIGNTYQIYREILHFLAVEDGLDNVYTSDTLSSGTLGPIKITKE